MPSLADIPAHLLYAENKLDFLAWLQDLPLTPDLKKELMSIWIQYVGTHFTQEDYNRIVGPGW